MPLAAVDTDCRMTSSLDSTRSAATTVRETHHSEIND
jgi:hypothetical protein